MNNHGPTSPAMAAYRMYAERYGDEGKEYLTFGQLVELYMNKGFVVSTPEFFICGRLCPKDASEDEIVNPAFLFPDEDCNAWYIGLMAGDSRLCWTYYPFETKYVGYQRNATETIRWFDMNTYRRFAIMGKGPKKIDPPEPAPPPPTTDNKDVEAQRRQARKNRADRRGMQSTLLSQNQGASQPATAGKTILG